MPGGCSRLWLIGAIIRAGPCVFVNGTDGVVGLAPPVAMSQGRCSGPPVSTEEPPGVALTYPENLGSPTNGDLVFAVMRVQASDRQASRKTEMASTNQRPRAATLAAYVTTSGSIRMPGVTRCRIVPATALSKSGRSSHSRQQETRVLDDDFYQRDHG